MNNGVRRTTIFACLALGVFAATADAQNEGNGPPETIPHKTNPHEAGAPTAGSTGVQTPDITYHGGPVLTTPAVYIIWYGNWNQSNGSDNSAGQQIVRDFIYGVSNSPYYQINVSYGGPSGLVHFGGETTDSYSQTARLTDAKVQAVVSHAITGGKLPNDPNGVYFVLTSSDVSERSGFCTQYCGWHTAGTIANSTIKYSFVGNAYRCLSACAAQTVGPNENAGVDGMISVIAHELEETNTDPQPRSGWVDSRGAENGDKCAWTFGANLKTASNGAYYNMTLPAQSGGSRNYLVQRNLDASSKCYVDYVLKTQ